MYSPQTHPKMYRGGRMTGAAFSRECDRISREADGLYFLNAHPKNDAQAENIRKRLEANEAASAALLAAYRQGR